MSTPSNSKNNNNKINKSALLFLIQATGFIKFVKQVFEPRSRWNLIDSSIPSRGRGEGKGLMQWKSNQISLIREYPCMSVPLPPFYHPLSYPQGKAIHPCPLLLTRQRCRKKARLFVCRGTEIWPWMLASVWQLVRKQKAGKATQTMCRCLRWRKKVWTVSKCQSHCGRRCRLISCPCLHILPLHEEDAAQRSNRHIYTNCPQLSSANEHSVTWRRKRLLRWTGGDNGWQRRKWAYETARRTKAGTEERKIEIKVYKRVWEGIGVWWRCAYESPREQAANMTDDDRAKLSGEEIKVGRLNLWQKLVGYDEQQIKTDKSDPVSVSMFDASLSDIRRDNLIRWFEC